MVGRISKSSQSPSVGEKPEDPEGSAIADIEGRRGVDYGNSPQPSGADDGEIYGLPPADEESAQCAQDQNHGGDETAEP